MTQEDWLYQQWEQFQGSGSGTLAEQADRFQNDFALDVGQSPIAQKLGGQSVLTDPFVSNGTFASNGGGNGWFGVINTAIGAATQLLTQNQMTQRLPAPSPGGMGGIIGPQVEVQTGMPISAAGLACTVKRRRYKIVRNPDGSIAAQAYCLPRRMNPLNPRALARAGRRVASFTRIANGMQKMLAQACKGASKPRRSRGYSCAPKRCR